MGFQRQHSPFGETSVARQVLRDCELDDEQIERVVKAGMVQASQGRSPTQAKPHQRDACSAAEIALFEGR